MVGRLTPAQVSMMIDSITGRSGSTRIDPKTKRRVTRFDTMAEALAFLGR